MTGSPLTAAALLVAVIATVAIGVYGVRFSRTTSDFLVASRTVGPQWNAAAISGEYLSAASFLGVAGLIAKYGADALWYPVGFTAGYLGLLLFVAAPLRRSGAYTVPDFAEFRLGSARLRRVAMLVVVVICVFYLVPQYQGAGLALKTLLGLPVWIGPLVVGGHRHRQRRGRRHAVDHVRPGIPVLAEADRDRDTRAGAAGPVRLRPRRAGRAHAPDGQSGHDGRDRNRRGGAGRRHRRASR